jgi:hypothetical protein
LAATAPTRLGYGAVAGGVNDIVLSLIGPGAVAFAVPGRSTWLTDAQR